MRRKSLIATAVAAGLVFTAVENERSELVKDVRPEEILELFP